MWTILITLAIGIIVGRLDLIPIRLKPFTQWITTGGLIVLLISMGAGISSNPQVLQRISQLGFQAFILALLSVLGSIILVLIVEKTFLKKEKGVEER